MDAGERVANDVADVESCEPVAEVDVPAVMLVEEDEPRFHGLVAGKGMSTGAEAVDEASRFCDDVRTVDGICATDDDSGDLPGEAKVGAESADGEGRAGGGGTGLPLRLATRELPPDPPAAAPGSASLAAVEAIDSPMLLRARRFALWLESRRELAGMSLVFRLDLRLRGCGCSKPPPPPPVDTRDSRGERPSSLASAAAVPSSIAAALSMSRSTPSRSRV